MSKPRRLLNDRELATVLHAFRTLQCEGRLEGCAAGDCEHFDPEAGGAEALTNAEIDDLCEGLNCGELETRFAQRLKKRFRWLGTEQIIDYRDECLRLARFYAEVAHA